MGKVSTNEDKGLAVISGKRDLMTLLVDKTLEYLRVTDPSCEIVIQDIATQYESLLDGAIQLVSLKDGSASLNQSTISGKLGNQKPGTVMTKLLQDKDDEIHRLKEQLA